MHEEAIAKPRLLFVDDERRVLNSMSAMFRRDYELFLTTRGDEALRIIDEQAIDVLVADQRMPSMTGLEVLSAARERSPGTVRILLTGYADPEAIEGAINDCEVFRLLNKPCPANELRGIISEAAQIARHKTNGHPAGGVNGHDAPDIDLIGETTATEIIMSGDTVTVRENGEDTSHSYRVAPPGTSDPNAITAELPVMAPPATPVAPVQPRDEPVQAPVTGPPPAAGEPASEPPLHPVAAMLQAIETDSPTLVLYGLGALLAILAFAWLLLSLLKPDLPAPAARPATSEPAPVTDSPAPSVVRHTLAENLELGALALDAGALITPADASALRFFLDARTQAPDNAVLIDSLERLARRLDQNAHEQLADGNFGGLVATLDALAAIDVADPRIAVLTGELDVAVAAQFSTIEAALSARDWDAASAGLDRLEAVPSADPQRVAAARETIERARERIAAAPRRGRSPTPAVAQTPTPAQPQDGLPARQMQSRTQPQTAQEVAATPVAATVVAEPEAATEESRIEQWLTLASARLRAGMLVEPARDSALYFLNEMRQIEPDSPALNAALIELANALIRRADNQARNGNWSGAESALLQAESLGVAGSEVTGARERLLNDRIAQQAARIVPVSEMQSRRFVPPEYPANAIRDNKEGWVVLHFTVQPDGTVSDIDAIDTSDRRRRFLRAATDAVRQWEFEPRLFLGQAIPQRVQARVNFELAD